MPQVAIGLRKLERIHKSEQLLTARYYMATIDLLQSLWHKFLRKLRKTALFAPTTSNVKYMNEIVDNENSIIVIIILWSLLFGLSLIIRSKDVCVFGVRSFTVVSYLLVQQPDREIISVILKSVRDDLLRRCFMYNVQWIGFCRVGVSSCMFCNSSFVSYIIMHRRRSMIWCNIYCCFVLIISNHVFYCPPLRNYRKRGYCSRNVKLLLIKLYLESFDIALKICSCLQHTR